MKYCILLLAVGLSACQKAPPEVKRTSRKHDETLVRVGMANAYYLQKQTNIPYAELQEKTVELYRKQLKDGDFGNKRTSTKMNKGWQVLRPTESDLYVHVVPYKDEKEHITLRSDCWCKPELRYLDEETHQPLAYPTVIHNSADMRELIEQAEAIK